MQRRCSTGATGRATLPVDMGRAGILLTSLFAFVGCGRTGLDLLGGGGGPAGDDEADGSGGVDGSLLDASTFDAASVDSANDRGIVETDASCTAPVGVGVGYCGPGTPQEECCKFDVSWTCGSQSYRVGGICGPADASPHTYQGVCDVNGQQTKTFMGTIGDCSCEDGGVLAALARAQCGPTVQQ